jgi:hypothetical protein
MWLRIKEVLYQQILNESLFMNDNLLAKLLLLVASWDSVVGIATIYGLDFFHLFLNVESLAFADQLQHSPWSCEHILCMKKNNRKCLLTTEIMKLFIITVIYSH